MIAIEDECHTSYMLVCNEIAKWDALYQIASMILLMKLDFESADAEGKNCI